MWRQHSSRVFRYLWPCITPQMTVQMILEREFSSKETVLNLSVFYVARTKLNKGWTTTKTVELLIAATPFYNVVRRRKPVQRLGGWTRSVCCFRVCRFRKWHGHSWIQSPSTELPHSSSRKWVPESEAWSVSMLTYISLGTAGKWGESHEWAAALLVLKAVEVVAPLQRR